MKKTCDFCAKPITDLTWYQLPIATVIDPQTNLLVEKLAGTKKAPKATWIRRRGPRNLHNDCYRQLKELTVKSS